MGMIHTITIAILSVIINHIVVILVKFFFKFDRSQTFLCGGVLYTGKYRNSYYMLELLTSFSIKLLCSLSDISEYLQYILAISVSGTYLVRNASISLSTYLQTTLSILMW